MGPPVAKPARQGFGLFGYLLARAGRREEATRELKALLEQTQKEGGKALDVALVYAGLENLDEALAWMQRAIDDQIMIPFSESAQTVRVVLDSWPRNARVIALRRSLGLQNR